MQPGLIIIKILDINFLALDTKKTFFLIEIIFTNYFTNTEFK